VGTANFVDPTTVERVLDGIEEYMSRHDLATIDDFHELLS
jgi:dihydroorotate dehydrogenase